MTTLNHRVSLRSEDLAGSITFYVRDEKTGVVEQKTTPAKFYFKDGQKHAWAFHPTFGDRVRFVEDKITGAFIPLMEMLRVDRGRAA